MAVSEPSRTRSDGSQKNVKRAVWAIGFGFTQLIIVVAFLLSLSINVADWLGMLESESSLIARIPLMTLLLVSVLAVYLLQERRQEHADLRHAVARRDRATASALQSNLRTVNAEQLSEFSKLLDSKGLELVGAVKGVFVEALADQEAYYRRLTREIQLAEKYVEDLTWGAISASTRANYEEEAYQTYIRTIPEVCRAKPSLKYRDVYTFPTLIRVDRAQRLLDHKLGNYWVRFYDIGNHSSLPPLMQFTIIDRRLIILGTHRGARGSAEGEKYLAIQHPLIAEKFGNYFSTIWAGAKAIRDPSTNDLNVLPRLRSALEGKKKK